MSITVYQNEIFMINSKNTSYVLQINSDQLLENIYWGSRIDYILDFVGPNSPTAKQSSHLTREELSSFGGMRFKETSMKVEFVDGVRDFRYTIKDYSVEENHLVILLEDINYSLQIELHYLVYEEEDIIKKWRVVRNIGEDMIVLERIYSAEYGLPGNGYESINCNGKWGSEFLMHSEPVDSGKKVYESLYGLSAHTASPYFIVHKNSTEKSGEVYYGVLEYSGNFKSVIESVNGEYVNVLIGISDTDFRWNLKGGDSFTTPAVYAGYSANGFEMMSNTLSAFSRKHIMPAMMANKPLPVLYNSWYSTTFDVHCDDQILLARRAARMGVELFVIDDGWFEGRVDDKTGLGDWYVDKVKFPDGLTPLINEVKSLGMKFGVWIEPEMISPISNLYHTHPEYIYRYQTRDVLMGRNQYMLDMTNPEVLTYLITCFDNLLSENDISYIKWDMNRYAAEIASPVLPKEEYKSIWYRNTEGVYQVIKELRERHPKVEFEACASGGGRVDFGAMRYFDEYWPSDNTDALDRLFIHENYSYIYPIKYMRAWLTDDFGMNNRKIPLNFSMHSAMCGALGIGTNLNSTPDDRLDELKEYVEEYKKIRNTVQFGNIYRLKTLKKDDIQAVQYVYQKESALFVFLDHERYGITSHHVKLRGLNTSAMYQFTRNGQEETKSGAYLMNVGLQIKMSGDYDSQLIKLNEI